MCIRDRVSHRYYTKMVEFFDINYSLLEVDEQADILAQYSKLINYFDPSVRLSLIHISADIFQKIIPMSRLKMLSISYWMSGIVQTVRNKQ